MHMNKVRCSAMPETVRQAQIAWNTELGELGSQPPRELIPCDVKELVVTAGSSLPNMKPKSSSNDLAVYHHAPRARLAFAHDDCHVLAVISYGVDAEPLPLRDSQATVEGEESDQPELTAR
jgi:hypothetical protein